MFVTGWDELVTSTAQGDYLRTVRVGDTLGHFQRYLNAHFFGKEALTPKTVREVQVLIAAWLIEVARGRAKIKEGQSAWMAFTGAWGRRPDDTIEVEYVPPQRRT
jgi:hypothetical protein